MDNPFDIAERNLASGATEQGENPFDVAERSFSSAPEPSPFDIAEKSLADKASSFTQSIQDTPVPQISVPIVPFEHTSSDDGGFGAAGNVFQRPQSARDSKPSDVALAKLAPLVNTPEQQTQLHRVIDAQNTEPLPVSSTLGQVAEAAFAPPKPFTDLVEVGRGIQQNNRDTTLALRSMAKKAGLEPDSVAKLPAMFQSFIQGGENALVDLGLSLTSPVGVAALGLAALPETAQKAASLGFSAQMLSEFPEQARQLVEEENKPVEERDNAKIAQLYFGALGSSQFGLLAGAHGTSKSAPKEASPAAAIPDEVNLKVVEENPPVQPAETDAPVNPQTPTTIIKGIVAKPVDADTHTIAINGKDSAVLKFVDNAGLESAQQSVGQKGWEGYFISPDPETQQPTIYINRNYIDRQGPIFTHETTHLLDNLGLVTPEQMDSVVEKYGKDIIPEVTKRNEDFAAENNQPAPSPDYIKREVFANIFQNWHENDNAPKVTWIHKAIDFVRNVVGLGKTARATAQDILGGKFEAPQESSTTSAASVPILQPHPVSEMPLDDFFKMTRAAKGGLTGEAYRVGQSVKTPEELDALKTAQEKSAQDSQAYQKSGEFDKGMIEANRGQFFREAYEAATGTGSAGQALSKDPAYKPPFPESGQPQFSVPKDQTETPEFKNFFEGSKVVDSQGKPLKMYHGTSTGNFTIFDPYSSNHGLFGGGTYFTDNPEVASSYVKKGKGENQSVIPTYLSIKNPIDFDAPADISNWQKAAPDVDFAGAKTNEEAFRKVEEMVADQGVSSAEGSEWVGSIIRSMGYDGGTHIGGGRVKSDGVKHRVYIAFEPEQIKSAIGNSGAFDVKNPDIRFSVPKEKPTIEENPRAQVGAIKGVGEERNTESISDNQAHIRSTLFDSTKPVSEENTSSAWQVFGEMTGKEKAQNAAQIKSSFGDSRLVLPLYKGEVWRYALKMAVAGDESLLRAMYDHSESFETLAGGGASTAGSALRGEAENFNDSIYKSLKNIYEIERETAAQHGSRIDRETFFKLLERLRNLKLTPEEIEAAGKGKKLPNGKTIDETVNESAPKPDAKKIDEDVANQIAKDKLNELQLKYDGAEWLKPEGGRNQVLQVIEDALKGQSRDDAGKIVLGPDGEPLRNPVLENQKPVAESTAQKLITLGVDSGVAHELGFQIENARKTEFANRRTKALQSAANSRNIRSLIDSVLETPYRAQSDPKWLHETAVRWFESNGLGKEQAEAASRLFQEQFKEALAKASTKIAADLLKKGAPKAYEDLSKLIRAGVFDPARNWVDELAVKTGWKKPTVEQMKTLQELDSKLTNPELSPEEVASLNEEQMRILRHIGKKDGAALRALGESFTASLLSGIRTLTVQLSAGISALRDAAVAGTLDPKNALNFATAMKNSLAANAKASFKYAWMKDAYGFHMAEIENGFNELKRVAEESSEIIKSKTASPAAKGLAYIKQIYALQRFVLRNLSSLDQASMAVIREWKLAYYSAQAFKEAGLSTHQISDLIDAVELARRNSYETAVESGLDHTTAQVRSNSRVKDAVWDFVNNKTGSSELANDVLKSAENDAYSAVGRTPHGISSLDEGFLSKYLGINKFIQFTSSLRAEGGLQNVGTTALAGMIAIPFRTMKYFSDFSPYGLLRYGIYKYRTNRGLDNYWKQSYGTALQARARLQSALAGTAAMLAGTAWALNHQSSDDKAGNEDFGLYITGKGPDNKVLADAWAKRGFKQYSANFVINGRIVSIPLTRAGESFLFPFILPAALDDYAWKRKEAVATGHPIKDPTSAFASSLIGEALSMTGQSGILQTFGQLQQATQNGGSLSKAIAKVGIGAGSAVAVPFKQLLSSISEMMYGTLDSSSVSSLIANQFPIIGLPWQQTALNRFGDPVYDRSWYGLASRTGVPLAFQVDKTPENERLYTTLVDKGAAPPPLVRANLETKYGELTNEQFKNFVIISGGDLKKTVEQNLAVLQTMSPEDAKKFLTGASAKADAKAAGQLGLVAQKQAQQSTSQGQAPSQQAPAPQRTRSARIRGKNLLGSIRRRSNRLTRRRSTRSRVSALRSRRASAFA